MRTLIAMAAFAMPATVAAENAKPPAKPGAKIEMPKPAPELAEMAKGRAGTWTCKGKAWMPDGSEHAMTGAMKSRSDLDGFWIHDTWDGKMDQIPFKFEAYTTYDSKSKQLRRVVADSLGGQQVGTSDGLNDNKIDFTIEAVSVMGPMTLKEHVDKVDPRTLKITTERSTDKGKTFEHDFEITCTK
jgi:hypothetical protein